jgi:hypothetical protein
MPPMGHFSLIRYRNSKFPRNLVRLLLRPFRGNLCARRPFPRHENKTLALSLMRADDGLWRGERASPAYAVDTTGPDGSAVARAHDQLCADATRAAARHDCP